MRNARFLLLLVVLLLPACASKHMAPMAAGEQAVVATENDAVVIFMRPSAFGGAIQSSVFDATDQDNKFLGIVSTGTKVSYTTSPGKKLFMVVSEAADFMQADLEAGKTYFALVTPRMGFWKARFSLKPISKEELATKDFTKWDTKCDFVKPLPSAHQWADENAEDILSKRASYYGKWAAQPEEEKPTLRKEDGKDTTF